MAGETIKTTALTNVDAGKKTSGRVARGTMVVAQDKYQYASVAGGLDTGDILIMDIRIPSNAIVHKIEMYNDDLDTAACPTLALDIGVAAAADYKDDTSGTITKHAKDAVIDADLFADGITTGQAATTLWTQVAYDSATFGPDDMGKKVWELLGYSADPGTDFNLVVVAATAATTLGAAGDLAVRVEFTVD